MSFSLQVYWYKKLIKFSNPTILNKQIEKDLEYSKKESAYQGRVYRQLGALFSEVLKNSGILEVPEGNLNALIAALAKLKLFNPSKCSELTNLIERCSKNTKIFPSNRAGETPLEEEKLPLPLRDRLIAALIRNGFYFSDKEVITFERHRLDESLLAVCETANGRLIRKKGLIAACHSGNLPLIQQMLDTPFLGDKEVAEAIFYLSDTYPEAILTLVREKRLSFEMDLGDWALKTYIIDLEGMTLKTHILEKGNPSLILELFSHCEVSVEELLEKFCKAPLPDKDAHLAVKEWIKRLSEARLKKVDGITQGIAQGITQGITQGTFARAIRNLAKIGSLEGVQWILNNLPQNLHEKKRELLNSPDEDGNTPLHLACECGRGEETALFLLENGARFDVENDEGRVPPLDFALMKGYDRVVRKIVSLMPHDDQAEFFKNGSGLLYVAIDQGHEALVSFFLKNGVSLEMWLKSSSHIIYNILSQKKNSQARLILEELLKREGTLLPLFFQAIADSKAIVSDSDRKALENLLQGIVDRFSPNTLKEVLNQSRSDKKPFETALATRSFLIKKLIEWGAEVFGVAPLLKDLLHLKFPLIKEIIEKAPEEEKKQCIDLEKWDEVASFGPYPFSQWVRLLLDMKGERYVADQILALFEQSRVKNLSFFLKAIAEFFPSKKEIFEKMISKGDFFKNDEVDFTPLLLNQFHDYRVVLRFPEGIRIIPVFKAVMALRSPFFCAMFQGNSPEGQKTETVFECKSQPEADRFEKVILFLHSKKIEITHMSFRGLARLANSYEIPPLRNALEEWVKCHPECAHWDKKYLNPVKALRKSPEDPNDGDDRVKKRKVEERLE